MAGFSTISLRILMLFSLVACALAVGCTTGQRYQELPVDGHSVSSLQKDEETDDLNDQILSAASFNTDPSDYLLGAGDLLQISVFECEDLNTKVRVTSRGYVTLPLVGQMKVKGLTARETEIEIEKAYKQRYLKDPHIGVFVEEHFSQRVTLMGQFKTPGTFDYLSKMRLLDVLALGGGLTDQAGRTAQVRRMAIGDDPPKTFLVDLDMMIRQGHNELNIEINGGDVIFVPEAGVFFVDGAVSKPGAYPIKRSTRLFEALSQAGGLKPYAKSDSLLLVRYKANGERTVLELNLKEREVQETLISDRDVILVKASGFGKAMHGFGLSFGIPGMASFGYVDPERR